MTVVFVMALASAALPASSPLLGTAEGRCRQPENGPAFLVSVVGLKDRKGTLKLEVYPANDQDFLADDNVLIGTGKVFRRVVMPMPVAGRPQLCVRVPEPGPYAVMVLHDRDSNHKFNFTSDGVAFAGDPKLGWSKPRARVVQAVAGAGVTPLTVRMNYRTGLASFGPLAAGDTHEDR